MKKRWNSNKLVAIFLVLALMLSIGLTVNANTVNGKHNITIEGAGTGHKYKIYQVFTGNLNDLTEEIGDIEWGNGVNHEELLTELKASTVEIKERKFDDTGANPYLTGNTVALKEVFHDCNTAYDVAHALSQYEDSSDAIREFAEIIANNLQEGNAINAVEEGNKYTATDLATGYYFIKDSETVAGDAQTRYILNLVKDSTITVKSEAPTMELKVKNEESNYVEAADYQITDEIEFQMTGKLPSKSIFDDYNTYKYIFHITIPGSLEYQEGSFTVSLKKGDTTTDIKSYFKETVGDEITIGCDDIKEIAELTDTTNTEIIVTYKTKLVGTAEKETKNITNAYLEFSDNPNKAGSSSTSNTLKNSASVYTYVLDIEKVNGKQTSQTLDGVGFKLYEGTLDTPDGNKKWAKIDGDLIVGWVDSESEATEMITKAGGKINIYGLDNKTYVLKETKTLDGFNTRDNMEFKITSEINNEELNQNVANLNLQIKDQSEPVTGNTNTLKFELQVLNYPGILLPETGGIGTIIFYIIGGIFLVSAIILMLLKKKKKSE